MDDLLKFYGDTQHINPTKRCKVCHKDKELIEFLQGEEACKSCIKRCNRCHNNKTIDEFYDGKTICKNCILAKKKEKYQNNRKSKIFKDYDKVPDFYTSLRSALNGVEQFYSKNSHFDKISGKYTYTITFVPSGEVIYRSNEVSPAFDRIHLLHFALLKSGFKYDTPKTIIDSDINFNNNLEKKLTFDEIVDRDLKEDVPNKVDYINMLNSISKSFDNIRNTIDSEYKNIQNLLLQNILNQNQKN